MSPNCKAYFLILAILQVMIPTADVCAWTENYTGKSKDILNIALPVDYTIHSVRAKVIIPLRRHTSMAL